MMLHFICIRCGPGVCATLLRLVYTCQTDDDEDDYNTEVLVVHAVRKGAVAADDVVDNCDDGDGDEATVLTMWMLTTLSAGTVC